MNTEITRREFLEETGIDERTFGQACRLGLIPLLENGNIDFSGGWVGLNGRIEIAEPDASYISGIRSTKAAVEERISKGSSHGPRQPIPSPPKGEERGEFFSEEGQRAFEKAASRGQVRIKGQQIDPRSSQEWWEADGFLSEEAALAFRKAEAQGLVRIFSRK
jgi:hypothetical protein